MSSSWDREIADNWQTPLTAYKPPPTPLTRSYGYNFYCI